MPKREPDPNEDAARVIREATDAGREAAPKGLEAAWSDWARRIQGVDQRTLTLLRAAFEAGYEAGNRSH